MGQINHNYYDNGECLTDHLFIGYDLGIYTTGHQDP